MTSMIDFQLRRRRELAMGQSKATASATGAIWNFTKPLGPPPKPPAPKAPPKREAIVRRSKPQFIPAGRRQAYAGYDETDKGWGR